MPIQIGIHTIGMIDGFVDVVKRRKREMY